MNFAIVSCLLVLLAWPAAAATIDVAAGEVSGLLSLEVLPDHNGEIRIEDLLAEPESWSWQTTTAYAGMGRFADFPHWFRLRLTNSAATTERRFLEIAYADLPELDFYLVSNGQLTSHNFTGSARPYHSRASPFPGYIFPLSLQSDTTTDAYVRLGRNAALILPVQLMDGDGLIVTAQNNVIIDGIYIGVILMLIAIYLLAAAYLRDSMYMAASAWVASVLLFTISISGLGYHYLWPTLSGFNQYSVNLFSWLSLLSVLVYVLLSSDSLRIRPLWSAGAVTLFLSFSVFMLVQVSYNSVFSYTAVALHVFALILVIGFLSVDVVKLHGLGGVFRVLSLLVMGIGGSALMASRFAGLLYDPVYLDFARIGLVIGAVLLALSLVEDRRAASVREARFRREVHNKENQVLKLRERSLKHERKLNESLERRVKLRTRELSMAMAQLTQSHALLEAKSNIDPLTEAHNRHFFNLRYEEEWRRALRNKTHLSLAIFDIDHMHQLNANYGYAIGDEVLRRVSQAMVSNATRGTDVISRYGGDEFALILPDTDASGARVVVDKVQRRIRELEIEADEGSLGVTVSVYVKSGIPVMSQGWRSLLVEATWGSCHLRMGKGNRILIEPH